jgi:hypothetical protein
MPGKKATGKHNPGKKGTNHAQGFDLAMEEALKDAASKWGVGTHPAKITFEVSVEVTNPGHVGEYRVILDGP